MLLRSGFQCLLLKPVSIPQDEKSLPTSAIKQYLPGPSADAVLQIDFEKVFIF
jgi:hypothetical protein